jgi:methylenetetrahydrofolate reductase (NADPH)
MKISLEAVPRNKEALISCAAEAAAFLQIGSINIPDLTRFTFRSWDACSALTEALPKNGEKSRFHYIPHIRAIDFKLHQPFPCRDLLRSQGVNQVLVIAGDLPRNFDTDFMSLEYIQSGKFPEIQTTETVPFIKKLRAEMPELTIYAAFDPYRTNIRYELDYLGQKEAAGAAGFMSQPFFDLRLLEIYAEYLEGKEVFWGLSPVLSQASRNYWESRNRAIFPKHFRPDLEWNIDFGRRVISFCEAHHFNVYLMPIKVDIKAYLSGLFA